MTDRGDHVSGLRFAELLCARLCHDLAGAVGAAAAGAELLEDGCDAETAGLVADSAAGAVARLKFLRAAFGPAPGDQDSVAVRDLCAAYVSATVASGGGAVELAWSCAAPILSGARARLVMNLVLLARDSLPRGGRIEVTIEAVPGPGSVGLRVGYQGMSAALPEEAVRCLDSGQPPGNPRAAQAWLTERLAVDMGSRLERAQVGMEGRFNV